MLEPHETNYLHYFSVTMQPKAVDMRLRRAALVSLVLVLMWQVGSCCTTFM